MFLTHPTLVHDTVRHGFFGRAGGVSTGIYRGLNCGPGSADDPAAVVQNRAIVARAMGAEPAQLLTLYQIHSAEVVTVEAPFTGDRPQADALVTRAPGMVLGILTADCAPVLFADAEAGVIGAAHAGWKGAHGGVLEHTVAAMERLGAKRGRIAAVVGPCIAQASYEVGPEFIVRFAAEDRARFFVPSVRAGHSQFDLAGFVVAQLERAGVSAAALGIDTCVNEEAYFSYRRKTLRGEPDYGRHISAITLVR